MTPEELKERLAAERAKRETKPQFELAESVTRIEFELNRSLTPDEQAIVSRVRDAGRPYEHALSAVLALAPKPDPEQEYAYLQTKVTEGKITERGLVARRIAKRA